MVEPIALMALPREELDDGHALQGFLEESVEASEPRTDLAIGAPGADAEVRGDHDQEGQEGERHQGQAPVHPDHDGDHAHQGDHVAHHGEQAAGKGLAHRLGVVQHAGHEPSHRHAVVEARVEAGEMHEEHGAQVMHDALPDHVHEVGVGRPERVEDGQDEEEQHGHRAEAVPVAA
jgi:hypothetical protein